MPYNEAVLGQEDSSVKITSIKASFYFDSQLSLSLRLKYSVQLAQHIQSPLIKHIRKRFQIPDPISDPAASEVIFRKETDIMCPDSSNISMNLDVLSKSKQLYYSVLTECHSAAPLTHLIALTPQFTPPSATEGNLYIATLPLNQRQLAAVCFPSFLGASPKIPLFAYEIEIWQTTTSQDDWL